MHTLTLLLPWLRPQSLLLALLLILAPVSALAGSISISTSAVVHYSPAEVRLELTVRNVGDDPAMDVAPEVHYEEALFTAPARHELAAGATHRFDITIPHGQLAPGEFPLLVRVLFHDSNGYPFSAVSVATFTTTKERGQAGVVLAPPKGPVAVNDDGALLAVSLNNQESGAVQCRVRLLVPNELNATSSLQTVAITPGQSGSATFFIRNRTAMVNATYPLVVVAEYELAGKHYTVSVYPKVVVSQGGSSRMASAPLARRALLASCALFLLITVAVAMRGLCRGQAGLVAPAPGADAPAWFGVLDAVGLMLIYTTLGALFDPRLLLLDSVLVGGDSSSWQGIAQHLLDVLLPAGRLTGWDLGNFCGYPNFTFYFIPPFLLAALPAYWFGLPLTVTLKCATMSGVVLLPISAYWGMRLMRFRFPAPLLAAAASLVFMLNEGNTMFGGNMLSTLSGEFSYMFAFALLPLFLGLMWRGSRDGRGWVACGVLLGFIGLSHLFVFIPAVFIVMAVFCLSRQGVFVVKTSLLGFGVMAFWLLPLLAYRNGLTTPVYMIWHDFANWRYSACGLGLLLAVTTPLTALASLRQGDAAAGKGWRLATLASLLLTAVIAVYLLGQFGLYGRKFWGTGFASPTLTEAVVGWQLAGWLEEALLPVGLLLGAALVWKGLRASRQEGAWQTFVGWLAACFLVMWSVGGAVVLAGLLGKGMATGAWQQTLLSLKGRWLVAGGVFVAIGWLPLWRPCRQRLLAAAQEEGDDRLGLLMFMIGGCLATYGGAHYLQIPDIRFLPPILFAIHLLVCVYLPDLWFGRASRWERVVAAVTALSLAMLLAVITGQTASSWFRDNNRGYQALAGYGDFMRVNTFLRESYQGSFPTPLAAPRVAYEKADGYGIYGGDRAFESLLFFSGRQTMEGIHYSSSPASKFMAFFQSEYSRDLKEPVPYILSRIRPDILPKHCDLYNVSQIVVRTDTAKTALDHAANFKREFTAGSLAVYRYTKARDAFVEVPAVRPVMIPGRDWLGQFYHWYRLPEENDVLLVAGDLVKDPEDRAALQEAKVVPAADLSAWRGQALEPARVETSLDHLTIRFTTDRIGTPHLIKVSYFPNWQVQGAHGIYPVSPHLMLVIPRQAQVTLTYGRTRMDWLGDGLTLFSLALVPIFVVRGRRRPEATPGPLRAKADTLLLGLRRPVLWLLLGCALTAGVSGVMARNPAVRVFINGVEHFNEAAHHREKGDTDAANRAFRQAITTFAPLIEARASVDHQDVINAMLFSGMSYESVGEPDQAERLYRVIIDEYPFSRYLAEGEVRIAQLRTKAFRQRFDAMVMALGAGRQLDVGAELKSGFALLYESLDHLQKALSADPQSTWGGYGREEMARIEQDLSGRERTLGGVLTGLSAEARDQALALYRDQAAGITALVGLATGAGGGP
jgi:hypothetical protein